MPLNIIVQVPDSIRPYYPLMIDFFKGMITKLDKNSHKETPETKDIPEIVGLLMAEVMEFEEQLAVNKFDENSLIELMDVANFALLAYIALRFQGVTHDTKRAG